MSSQHRCPLTPAIARPFAEAVHELKKAGGLTHRELAEKARALEATRSPPTHTATLAGRSTQPSKRANELIALACGLQPERLLESRLATRRKRALNELGDRTTRPLGQALHELKDARALTHRELAEKTRALDGNGIKRAYPNLTDNARSLRRRAR